jgi:hypothetical protein
MRAGTACLDITPPLGCRLRGWFTERIATAVRDPLRVRAIALDDGATGLAIAVCDLLQADRGVLDAAKARIAKSTPLRPSQVLLSCTHTHEGPELDDDSYREHLAGQIAAAVTAAWEAREPAAAGGGRAGEPRLLFNRRFEMADGSVLTNPGLGHPNAVRALGPVDPEVAVLGLRRPNGRLLGALAAYGLHYIGVPGDDHSISADYFGEFCRQLPALAGEEFTAILANGASGDVNNLDVSNPRGPANDRGQHTRRVGGLVAAAALWALGEAEFSDEIRLGAAVAEVLVPAKPEPTAAEMDRARDVAARAARGEGFSMGDRVASYRLLRGCATHPGPRPSGAVATWVQAMRVGDVGIVGLPGELFAALGLDIKRRSPFPLTLVIELANDCLGYLSTRAGYDEGGYEPASSDFAPGCGELLCDAAVELLQSLA